MVFIPLRWLRSHSPNGVNEGILPDCWFRRGGTADCIRWRHTPRVFVPKKWWRRSYFHTSCNKNILQGCLFFKGDTSVTIRTASMKAYSQGVCFFEVAPQSLYERCQWSYTRGLLVPLRWYRRQCLMKAATHLILEQPQWRHNPRVFVL